MRNILYVIFVFLAFHTEGVCQLPVPSEQEPDSTYIQNNMDDEEGDEADLRESAYQKAIQEYYQEQVHEQDFDKENWKKVTKGLDYTVKPPPVEKEEEPLVKNTSTPHETLGEGTIAFLKWTFIIIAIFLIAYLVLKFVNEGNVFGRQVRRVYAPSVTIDLENIEENLQDSELDPIIKKAIEQKQYSLAIRLYYLAIIKELNQKDAIKWKKDKTNSAYVREMRPHRLFEPFRDITNIFERVWYGNVAIEERDFLSIQPTFQDLLKQTRG